MNQQEIITEIREIGYRRGSLKADNWVCLDGHTRCDRTSCCSVCSDWYRYWVLIEEVKNIAEAQEADSDVSLAFRRIFANQLSSVSLTCGFCNKVREIKEGESFIHFGILDDKTLISDCSCGSIKRYEKLFRDHRAQILEFFKQI